MAASDNLSKALFHGTDANVEEGEYIHPVGEESPLYSSTHKEEAATYGKHLYQVQPTNPSDLYLDHSLTRDGKKVDNYATAYPYEVVKKLR